MFVVRLLKGLKGSLRRLVRQPRGNPEFWDREGSFLSFPLLEGTLIA